MTDKTLPAWVETLQRSFVSLWDGSRHLPTEVVKYADLVAACPPEEERWERRARETLWLHHGCPNAALYGDDGEMQCNNGKRHGLLDFKRQTWDALTTALVAAHLRDLAALPPAVPARCDHKFIDSTVCLKCGWEPPAVPAQRVEVQENKDVHTRRPPTEQP